MLHKAFRRFFSSNLERQVSLVRLANEHKGISLFEINKPDTKNALSRKLIEDLKDAINQTRTDNDCRVVILRSKIPGVFCAGADLKERINMTKNDTENFVCLLRDTFDELYHLPVPVIACIDGPALGGGCEIALSCDIRVATKSSLLGLPETSLAIIPGAGGTQKLARIVGIAKAKELIYTGKRLTAEEAKQIGLINYVEEDYEKAYDKSISIAKDILPKGPIAIKQAKQALNASVETDLKTGLNIERMLYSKIIDTQDRIEGLKAFLEKRKPQYKGE